MGRPRSRRDFIRVATTLTGGMLVPGIGKGAIRDPWDQVPDILARIKPPTFPKRVFDVTAHGAVGDGKTKNTAAFRKAIEECQKSGGGRVLVPAGTFLTGAIRLLGNVELHVAEKATIKFSTDPKDYLPTVLTRWEGTLCHNYSPFIYAFEQKNVGITGKGTIDGDAQSGEWRSWGGGGEDRARLRQMGRDGTPVEQRVFGEGHKLRPNMIQLFRCRNLLVEDVTIQNPAMWSLHPVFCTNVTVRNVHIYTTNSQGDGVDLDSTTDAHVADCRFNTNDDCVVIKSGRDADGRHIGIPTSNVVVERCRFSGRWGGITVGSEVSGGARNIFTRDCQVNAADFPGRYPIKHALYVKTNKDRGGAVEGIHLRNVTGRNVEREVLYVSMYYDRGGTGNTYPAVGDITVEGMVIDGAKVALHLDGFPESHIKDVLVRASRFTNILEPNLVRHTDNLVFRDTTINGKAAEAS